MSKGVRRTRPLRKDLPAYITRKIGQIITKYAYLDYKLKTLVWKLAGVDETVGRLAIRDPRAVDKLTLCRELLFVRGVSIEDAKFRSVSRLLQKVESFRDLLAHGVWTEEEGTWWAIYFKGNLADQAIPPIARKRALRPEAIKIERDDGLNSLLAAVDSLIESIESLEHHASLPKAVKSASKNNTP
ncbi:MAG: hypothetical protein ACOZAM_19855 [Pseudomonadota bacterium]